MYPTGKFEVAQVSLLHVPASLLGILPPRCKLFKQPRVPRTAPQIRDTCPRPRCASRIQNPHKEAPRSLSLGERRRLWTFLISFSTLDPILETIYLFTSFPSPTKSETGETLKEAGKLSREKNLGRFMGFVKHDYLVWC